MLTKLYRRQPNLVWLVGMGVILAALLGWVVLISPTNGFFEAVFVALVGGVIEMGMLKLSKKLKWRIAVPVVLVGLLIMNRLGMLDLVAVLIGFGILGLVSFIN